MKEDFFGYETQGTNYQTFRPKYPVSMIDQVVSQVKNKGRYLDVATGTGQLLFQIFHLFKQSEGSDLSPTMLSVCKKNIQQKNFKGITLTQGDFMKVEVDKKYDLITVGQALHWFPVREFLKKAKNALQNGGILGILSYILAKVQAQNPQQMPQLPQLYQTFYDKKVKKNNSFNMDQLHTHYKDKQKYPFEQIFGKVDRKVIKVQVIFEKQAFLAYLKTWSCYNTYLERYKNQQDPMLQMQSQIPPKMRIKCTFDYFSVICS